MVEEVVGLLQGASRVLDCTLGGGGHSEALLANGSSLVAIDQDEAAITEARERLAAYEADGRFLVFRGNFADLDAIEGLRGRTFDGILADLGASSPQIDPDERRFSFRPGALLDMRMDRRSTGTAADLLNTLDEAELTTIFHDYGDEPRARRLAREVVRRRERRPMRVSDDLVDAIRGVFGARSGPSEFARLFQAVRIAVNDELRALESALPALRDALVPGGRLAVITYHSGEDRLVKLAFREWASACICPPRQPVCTCRGRPLRRVVPRKPIVPEPDEVAANPRARSAHLRIFQAGDAP